MRFDVGPFSALKKALEPVFEHEGLRNEKYFAPIQALKDALDNYKANTNHGFTRLLEALIASKPFIEKWPINFKEIKRCMDELAQLHQLPTIKRGSLLSRKKNAYHFDFDAGSDEELIPWLESKLESKSGSLFSDLNSNDKVKLLLNNVELSGFSKKITAYLKKAPDFLFQLLLTSESNFTDIAKSRLSLFLTDVQLAWGIKAHAATWLVNHPSEFVQIEKFIDKLNDILSNGRSVSILLKNEQARTVLNELDLFKRYESEEYKNRHQVIALEGLRNP